MVILPLNDGEFFHYGTSRELIENTQKICPRENSNFVQNAVVGQKDTKEWRNTWIENSWIGNGWKLTQNNIITGVPCNDWSISLEDGMCVDVVPIGEDEFVLRPYGINDKFRGSIADADTLFLGQPMPVWLVSHDLCPDDIDGGNDLQSSALFPVSSNLEQLGELLSWMLTGNGNQGNLYKRTRKISADDISNQANLLRLQQQRMKLRCERILSHIKGSHAQLKTSPHLMNCPQPHLHVGDKQTVNCYSPVRIDLAGGWTDTPPFCFTHGGNVVNLAVELNGKAPLQTIVRGISEYKIILRSIDFGAYETVTTYEQLADYAQIGSPFSIPKAALTLAGFLSGVDEKKSLVDQLEDFGCGIEITLHSKLPAGSGMGTSSILAATVLGALNEFCGLGWTKNEICHRTLLLEQLLTTGGGWQDQYGGILNGLKLLSTHPGLEQTPEIKWLPEELFTSPEYSPCHILYYTGLTRMAKKILVEVVHNMMDFNPRTINLLKDMQQHANELAQAISQNDFQLYGQLIGKSWIQNKELDAGTNPPEVESIIERVQDFCLGYKLPGAGGGGFLYMVAKDVEAANRIRKILTTQPPNDRACLYDMRLSQAGMIVQTDSVCIV